MCPRISITGHVRRSVGRSVGRLHIRHNPLYPCHITHESHAKHHISFLDASSHLWSNPFSIFPHITFLLCISADPRPTHHQISFFSFIKIHEFFPINLMIISHVSYDFQTCYFKIMVHNLKLYYCKHI